MQPISFFLGANTPRGFYSLMDQMLPEEKAQRIYLIKGGPGCGKSSLMKKIGEKALKNGEKCEFIYCSGDPDSLDGLILPERGVALADATAPHVLEPKLPGIVEKYVNLGQFYNSEGLRPLRGRAEALMGEYKGCYRRAYRCLKGAESLRKDDEELVKTPEFATKMRKRAKGVIAREIPREGKGGQVSKRFLNGVTCRGEVTFWETAKALCPKAYEILDSYGTGEVFLHEVLSAALQRGHEVILCPDPREVERPRHLLLPGLGLCFVTTSPEKPLNFKPFRRIRLDAALSPQVLRQNKNRLKFSRKVAQSLEAEGMESLAKAKALHDELESLYNPWVDFEKVYKTAEKLEKEILGGE